MAIKEVFRIFIIIVLFYSTITDAKCRKLDKIALNVNYTQLIGHWNTLYSNCDKFDTKCSYIHIKYNSGNSLDFEGHFNNSQSYSGSILNCGSNKLQAVSNGITWNLYIIDTDYTNYKITYQCFAIDHSNGVQPKEFKELYRIWGRNNTIDSSLSERLISQIKNISFDVQLKPVSQSNCEYKSSLPSVDSKPVDQILQTEQPENSISPNTSSQVISDLKRCRNLNNKALRTIRLNEIYGEWNTLYSTNKLESSCLKMVQTSSSRGFIEFTKYSQCNYLEEGFVSSQSPYRDSSQIILTYMNSSDIGRVWILDTEPNHILVYFCREFDVNGDTRIAEGYKILGKGNAVPLPIFIKFSNTLKNISADAVLHPLWRPECDCSLTKAINTSLSEPSSVTEVSIPKSDGKRCRKFDDKAVKDLDLKKISGFWDILFTSENSSNSSCAQYEFNALTIELLELNKTENCNPIYNGLVAKCPPLAIEKTSKLIGTVGDVTYAAWVLDTDYNSYLQLYGCYKYDENIAKDEYQILGKNKTIEESVLNKLKTNLSSISNDIVLSPISQSNCKCDLTSIPSNKKTENVTQIPQNDKKCLNFETQSVKDINLNKLSGNWKLLYSSQDKSDTSCTDLQFKQLNQQSFEFRKSVKCIEVGNGIVSKSSTTENTAKLVLTVNNTNSTLWVLALNYSDYMLAYQCSKQDVNEIPQINDIYKIYGRKTALSVSDLLIMERILEVLSNETQLSPIFQSQCKCDENREDKTLKMKTSEKCRTFPTVKNYDQNMLGGIWKLLFHNSLNISCINKRIVQTNGTLFNTSLFFDTVNGNVLTAGLLEMLPNGNYLRRVENKTDENLYILYIDYNVFITYGCDEDLNSSSIIEDIGVYGRSNRFQNELPMKLINFGFKDKLFKLNNTNCKQYNGCPNRNELALKRYDPKKLSGKWYRIYSTDETECVNFEIEKSQSKRSSKKYFIKRQSADLLSTGFLKFESNGELICEQLGEQQSVYNIIATDYFNYWIDYSCLNNTIEINVLSRSKDMDPHALELAYSKLNAVGIDLVLKAVDQTNCSYEHYESISCKDCRDRALLNIDLNKFHGVWYPLLLNQPGAHCIRVEDNKRALSDPSNKDEYWYDIIDEKGVQGFGRIRTNEDGRLTELNFRIEGDRKLSVLDTDYDNYQIYYQCAIANINGIKRKIVEYGLMGRQKTVNSSIIEKAVKLFDNIGLGEVHPVDHENCHYNNISKRSSINDYHCKKTEGLVVKNVDLDQLKGKWFGLYGHHSGQTDVTSNFAKNTNSSSKYSHIFEIRYDDHILRGGIRLDENGLLYATSNNHISVEEFRFNVLDVDYNSHLIMYKCIEFDGSLSRLEKLHIFSRSCSLNQTIRNKAAKIVRSLVFEDDLSEIIQYQCTDHLKYDSRVLSENCRHFHNPEIIDIDFTKVTGNWSLQFSSSTNKDHLYDYYLVESLPANQLQINYFKDSKPFATHVIQHIKDSNLLRKKSSEHLGNCAVIATDYIDYYLIYSCVEREINGYFKAYESLNLLTFENLTANMDQFSELIEEIPAISLNKITDLIANLDHVRDDQLKGFGQHIKEKVIDMVSKDRNQKKLSKQSDKEVYHTLSKICHHFNEEELVFVDFSTIVGNWSLDFTTYVNEKIPFDRVMVTNKAENYYNMSLLNKDQLMANAITYHSNNSKILLSFLEGRRGRVIHLLANKDYRVVYVCSELDVNGTLKRQETLRLYSRENSHLSKTWYSYIEILVSKFRPNTWNKVSHLMQDLKPILKGCFDKNLSTNSIKTLLANYLTPKLQFEEKIHSSRPISKKEDIVVFKSLYNVCKHFDDEEMIETDFQNLTGLWRLDWSSFADNSLLFNSNNLFDLKLENDRIVYSLYDISNSKSPIKSKGYFEHVSGSKYSHNFNLGRRAIVATIWTDYSNNIIDYVCYENEMNGSIAGNEYLLLFSRNSCSNARDLSTYVELLTNNLKPKTLAKISHSINRLIPIDTNIISEELKPFIKKLSNRAMPKKVVNERFTFAEDIYFKFVAKGLVDSILTERQVSTKSDEEVYASLIKVCRSFQEYELVEMNYLNMTGSWHIDWSTNTKANFSFDTINNHAEGPDYIEVKYLLDSKLVGTANMSQVLGSKFSQRIVNGRRGRVALLYFDLKTAIIYSCTENEINGTITGREVLRFISRTTLLQGTDFKVYIDKLTNYVNPITWGKISDLVANLRPVDSNILNKECHYAQQNSIKHIFSKIEYKNYHLININNKYSDGFNQLKGISPNNDSVVFGFLEKNCRSFQQKDLIEPIFSRVAGLWRVNFASWLNRINTYDSIEFKDNWDSLYIERSLKSKVVSKGTSTYVKGQRYLRQVVGGRRGIESYLWTDYRNHLILYLCNENFADGVLKINENLRFLSRSNTTKSTDLNAFQELILSDLKDNKPEIITDLIANMRPVYNESDYKAFVQILALNNIKFNMSDDSCPNYDNISQKNVQFRKLTGRWDAIYTSNPMWDKDCTYSIDSYNKSSNSIISEKHTNNKTHHVVMHHSNNTGRQIVIVDNIEFQSWILATDYYSYKLSYTCYVKEVKGKNRKIDLQRLYTRGIEAYNFNTDILQKLRQKSAEIGKKLLPIQRTKCIQSDPQWENR